MKRFEKIRKMNIMELAEFLEHFKEYTDDILCNECPIRINGECPSDDCLFRDETVQTVVWLNAEVEE